MKNKNIGLYVGKFIAYHKGHQNCIQQFSNHCNKLNLILCGNSKLDRVPLNIRKNWIEKDLSEGGLKNYRERIKFHTLIEDNITPYPEGKYEWCSIVEKLLGEKVDVMFGNEDYVKECAEIFKSDYLIPDMDRAKYNVSSTKILDNGLKYYDLLTDVSKPYFNKKVLITGAESTGKSTLAKRLSNYFKGEYVEEYGRTYEEHTIKNFDKKCTGWEVKDYEQVAFIQNNMIKSALEKPVKILFVDTDALITEMYCELYLNKSSDKFKDIIESQNFDLIFYVDYQNTDWVHDGIRFQQEEREKISNIIKNKLKKYRKEFITIDNKSGYENRFQDVKKIVEEKFKL